MRLLGRLSPGSVAGRLAVMWRNACHRQGHEAPAAHSLEENPAFRFVTLLPFFISSPTVLYIL